jgi:hypothetical protein
VPKDRYRSHWPRDQSAANSRLIVGSRGLLCHESGLRKTWSELLGWAASAG